MSSPSRPHPSKAAWIAPIFLLAGAAAWISLSGSRDNPVSMREMASSEREGIPLRSNEIGGNDTVSMLDARERLGANAIPLAEAPTPAIPAREWMGSAWDKESDPAVRAFSEWANAYVSLGTEDRRNSGSQGVELANARRERISEWIDADPSRALANAIPAAIASELPDAVKERLETTIHGFGDLVTEYRCDDKPTEKILVKYEGKSYDARIYGSRKNLNYYLGTSLHGVALDDRMAVLDGPMTVLPPVEGDSGVRFLVGDKEHVLEQGQSIDQVERVLAAIDGGDSQLKKSLESKGLSATYSDYIYAMGDSGLSASSGYPKRRAISHTHGGKRILILRLRANDDSWPAAETEAVFQNWSYASDGWDARLRLTTYNKTWLEAVDVTPVLVLPNPASYYVYQSNGSTVYNSDRWANDGETAARSAGYNPDDYYCVVVGTRTFQNGGIGWAAGKRIWVNGAYDNFAALMNHEFGHILGLPHASAWSSSDNNPMSANRVNQEYGDENDPMGNGGKTFRNTYQAYFKNLSGWMPDSCVQTVTEDGIYTVYQDDGNTSFDRPLALKIARDHEIMYWLSIRGDLIQTNNIVNQDRFLRGVSVVAVTPWDNPHTLDLNTPSGNRADSPMALNQTFYDAAADITLKTVEVAGPNPNRYAKVQVTFGPLHRGGYRPLVSGGVYRFRNRHNDRYMTVQNNSSANGAYLQMANLNTTNTSQLFVAWRNENGSYSFNHQGTDKWLDVQSNSADTGVRIWQYTRSNTGDDAQNWNVFQTETDSVFLLHRGTEGRLIEMDVNNQRVHQMNTTGTNWQQWIPEMVAISPGTYRILPRVAETQALGIGHAAIGDGPEAIRSKFSGYADQQWTVSNLDNGRVRLTPAHSPGRALDVDAAASADGSRIQQWTWNTGTAQRWQFSRIDGHWLRFTPDCAPSSSLDARGAATGSTVQLWTYSGTQSQQWRFADADPNIVETPFAQWTRRLQLTGNQTLAGSDEDGDGVITLLEFALNGDPSSGASQGGYMTVPNESGAALISAVRSGASFTPTGTGSLAAVVDGIRYEVQGSLDLSDWSLPVEVLAALPPNEAPSLSEGWEYRAFGATGNPAGNVFLRMRVSDEP